MNWSNWIYLGAGLLVGMGLRSLFVRSSNAVSSSSSLAPAEQHNVPQLLQKIKQTQLAYQMAQEMGQFKAGFLARTTHELRSPLNSLIGLHQLILSDLCDDPAEEREFIAQAHEKALKLLHLIDEILGVARTEHGTNKLDIQPQCLSKILQEVNHLTYMLAANRNFTLRVLPPDPEIYVLADHRWLRQVLVSFVDTAITQMEEGSIQISSSLSPTSKTVHICLDLPDQALPNHESIDLIKSENVLTETVNKKTALSAGMKLLLNQTLLEVMGGKLEILPLITNEQTLNYTRVQVSIPLASPEAESPQLKENLN
ncbi:HAMP domain-containing histidine kinase [Nostoc sp. CENA67]|uniref:histidine kinase n=1 Tax=Amazonocrinis nigriterrae CENA67 TaxID=2794033 RepID=A0A8J7HXG2_9NOST|nr:HAMP domain-containing sensor histidine kinase [Amazonocrinis nigriterrae]MBH8566115.1 HAMP domain-containing histidine kinase [Amazonocrinis nigriterrae CENA67]